MALAECAAPQRDRADSVEFMLMQVGRRILLLTGSTLGLLADFIVAIVFAVTYSGGANLPPSASIASIVLVQIAPC